MQKIIIDTNFLLVPLQFRVDIFGEIERICNFNYKIYIFDRTIDELKGIIHLQASKHKKAAQFALKLIKLKNMGILKSKQKNVDSAILHCQSDVVVATLDIQLKKKLLKKGNPVIILRQKKYLQLI